MSNQEPFVSICMPTYNASIWIRDAIESALAQSWTNFELVISDNASTDGTLEIVRSFRDSRIRLEPSERNIGLTLNHNRVIKLSTGRYLKFLHADDVLIPTCLEEMVGLALEDERVGLVFTPRENVIYDENGPRVAADDDSRSRAPRPAADESTTEASCSCRLLLAGMEHNWIGEPSAVLVSRKALEECGLFNRYLRQTIDFELWLRVMFRCRVGFLEKPVCLYRMHEASVCASQSGGEPRLARSSLAVREPAVRGRSRAFQDIRVSPA